MRESQEPRRRVERKAVAAPTCTCGLRPASCHWACATVPPSREKNRWSLYAPVSSCIQTWIRATWYGAERVVRVVRESCEASEWCWLDFFLRPRGRNQEPACMDAHCIKDENGQTRSKNSSTVFYFYI